MAELLYETDWLASRPVFYNEETGAAGVNVNDVIAFADLEFDAEGLNAYLGSGFAVFGHTPVRGVRYLPPSSRLLRDEGGRLRVEPVPLDLDALLAVRHTEDEAVELLRERVRAAEAAAPAELVIPTSGGFDSRLLNMMVSDPGRVRSFTFGPTQRQEDSAEVARARALAAKLGTRWERIHLRPFHGFLDEWDDAFGPVIHAHGMYQMDFYSQVRSRVGAGSVVLSGLFGDWIEGKGDDWVPPVTRPSEVRNVVFTFVMRADLSASVVPFRGTLAEEYFETHREALASHRRRVIEAIRSRMMLLHYLLRVPELYGLASDAPFLDLETAIAMLSLPDERRAHRLWVRDYLRAQGAMLEDAGGSSAYWLYWPVMRAQPLEPLDEQLLAEVVRPEYVRWINRNVGWKGAWWEVYERLGQRRGFRRAAAYLRSRGIRQPRLIAYHAYMTLRPIQRLLQKRDAARRAVDGGQA